MIYFIRIILLTSRNCIHDDRKRNAEKTFRKIVASRSSKSTIIRIEGTPCYSRSSLDCSCRRESVIPPGRSFAAAWICSGKFRQRRSFTSISSRKPCCQLKRLRKVATLHQTVKPSALLSRSLGATWRYYSLIASWSLMAHTDTSNDLVEWRVI